MRASRTPNGRYKCLYSSCYETFARPYTAKRHFRIKHTTNARPFMCPTCKKSFTQRYDVTVHRRRVHTDKTIVNPTIAKALAEIDQAFGLQNQVAVPATNELNKVLGIPVIN